MNKIEVQYIDCINKESSLQEISAELDKLKKQTIGNTPWRSFPYKPEVYFTIAYNDCIFLKYYVEEKTIRACYHKTNDPVYKDSCVEFFVSFNDEAEYYNLEFNCIGTCLAGFRADKSNKKILSVKNILKIKTKSIITKPTNENPDWHWELTIAIPFEAFEYHQFRSLKNTKCKANFYKCGDDLPEPHYMCWNNIISEKPNFHVPEFFGKIHFS